MCLRPGVATQSYPSHLLIGEVAREKVERDDNGGESIIRIDAGLVVHIQPVGTRLYNAIQGRLHLESLASAGYSTVSEVPKGS